LLEESTNREGFGRFVFRAFPEHVDDIRAFTATRGGAVMLTHERSPEWERHAALGLNLAVSELLEREELRPDDITLFLPPLGSGRFVALLAETLDVSMSRFLDLPGEHRDDFTSSLGYGFLAARDSGRARPGDVGVILAAGSGGQVGCCVYYW
jgi:3-oxoacyl-[acyl-carrier-protein] synthase III